MNEMLEQLDYLDCQIQHRYITLRVRNTSTRHATVLQPLLLAQISSFSMDCCRLIICGFSWDPSFTVTEHAMTGRETPHALPRACLLRMNTYGTFLSSQRRGRCSKISRGSVSAAITTNSQIPRFKVLVASLAPFFSCL